MQSVDEKLEKDAWSETFEEHALPGEHEKCNGNVFRSFFDGFRRAPHSRFTNDTDNADNDQRPSPQLQRRLKSRHLQMIAIGGCIGSGLFVGSGSALAVGGPASLLIAFTLVGAMLFCTMHALGEMAVLFPVAGSFSVYSTRFLDPAWGFAMGWNYAMQWLVTLPLEITAASITVDFWTQGSISSDVWVAVFLVLIAFINLFGVKGYGEAEFIASMIKIFAVVGFIILGIVLNCGGGPQEGYIGGKYWHDPGAFNNGFKGLCSVLVTAAFSYSGTEMVGLAAAETENPRRALPTAIKQVFWRISIFFIVSLCMVGLLVPFNDERLLGSSSADASASPFVIAIRNAGIKGLPSVINAVIMIAVLSVGNSSVYGASRILAAMAEHGQAPQILGYIDKRGRPLVATCLSLAFGLVAFIAGTDKQATAFNWMLALSGLACIFTWGSICLAHIRFRRGWQTQGHSIDELAFRSQSGLVGSWFGLIFNVLVLVAQFWTGAWYVGYAQDSGWQRAETFFQSYLAAPVTMLLYVVYKVWYRTPFVRSSDMDVSTGIRHVDLSNAEEKGEQAERPLWKKVYKVFC